MTDLRGVEIKLQRASQQFDELRATVTAFMAASPFAVVQARDVQKERLAIIFEQRTEIPSDVPLLIGEMVGHLRSSLDYIVYALIVGATGAPPRTTKSQFPIFETAAGYLHGRADERLLLDVPQFARDEIRECQPFTTGEGVSSPLWHLRLLSNRDKHHDIVLAAAAMADPTVAVHPEFCEIFIRADKEPLTPGLPLFTAALTPGDTPFLEREPQIPLAAGFSLYLTFKEPAALQGLEVLKTLHAIGRRVNETVARMRNVGDIQSS